MAKEILLYTSVSAWSASDFIASMEQCKNEDVCIRMNTPGGSVYDGYGIIAKYNEFPNKKQIKVDGRADSFGAYFLCYTDVNDVECLDVSSFTFHRAAMPAWFEADANYFTEEVKAQLNQINGTLRAALESKCTAAKFKSITGTSLDDMFSLNSRIDVKINAEQAKKMGLVSKVNKITPLKLAEIKAYSLDLAAELTTHVQTENTEVMTIQDVKADSALYASLKAEIKTEVLAEEKIRISAFAAWKNVDAKAVLEHIVNGDAYNDAIGANMHVKTLSAKGIKALSESNAGDTNTDEQPDASTAEAAAFEAQKAEILSKAKKFIA